MPKKWFKKAVMKKPPFSLGGWQKTQPPNTRRRLALASRPKNWNIKRKYLSAARAIQALANVTKDKRTKQLAKIEAKYFFNKLKRRR